MQEHRFTVDAPFEAVAIALTSMGSATGQEADELHTLASLPEGGALLARPTWPDIAEIIIAEKGREPTRAAIRGPAP
jgi:hypothetical protein